MSDFVVKLVVLLVFCGGLIGYGVYSGRRTKSSSDFNLGDKSAPGWVVALSERAAAESAWTLVGLPGFAFMFGLVSIWVALGLLLGNILAWTVIAKKMREEAEKYEAQTYVDWIAKRHHGSKAITAVRVVGSFIVIFLFAFYIDAQLIGGGKTLNSLFGLPAMIGVLLMVIVILPYAVYGGYNSVVYADAIQSALMIGALVISPLYGLWYIGHTPDVWQSSIIDALKLASPTHMSLTGGMEGFAAGFMIANNFAWVIAYLGGMPHLTTRFMSMKDEHNWKIWTQCCNYVDVLRVLRCNTYRTCRTCDVWPERNSRRRADNADSHAEAFPAGDCGAVYRQRNRSHAFDGRRDAPRNRF